MAKNVLTFSMFNVYKSERSERLIDWFSPARSPASQRRGDPRLVVDFFLIFCLWCCVLIKCMAFKAQKGFCF